MGSGVKERDWDWLERERPDFDRVMDSKKLIGLVRDIGDRDGREKIHGKSEREMQRN